MIKVFLNWVQKTKPHIKSETGLLLFVPTIKLTVYLRIPCRIFINSLYNTESNYFICQADKLKQKKRQDFPFLQTYKIL